MRFKPQGGHFEEKTNYNPKNFKKMYLCDFGPYVARLRSPDRYSAQWQGVSPHSLLSRRCDTTERREGLVNSSDGGRGRG